MAKINCWEFKNCGRQPGGAKVAELGVCAAATEIRLDQVHGGKNAGRTCWVVAGTLCGGKAQGTFALKAPNCMNCEFYKQVQSDEKSGFIPPTQLLGKLR